uniref:ATP synthase F0 subunit 8 n=1 Tax=Holochilus sciureus TaxID=89098 RepID=UPI001FAEEF37|nr:ATP synthase F0 subunit 8 [Holochilus sciureus]ULD67424.1 ATP synthase F0 subunit 8 [Holochilus sciureus]
MPQLDTSTWFTVMLSSSLTLFMLMQLKIYSQDFPLHPMSKKMYTKLTKTPWELKWTKIYLLPSLPLQ